MSNSDKDNKDKVIIVGHNTTFTAAVASAIMKYNNETLVIPIGAGEAKQLIDKNPIAISIEPIKGLAATPTKYDEPIKIHQTYFPKTTLTRKERRAAERKNKK